MYIPMVVMLLKLFVQIFHKEGVESRGNRDIFSLQIQAEWQITGLTSNNQVTYYSTILLRDSSSTKSSKYFPVRQKCQDVVILINLRQQKSSHKERGLTPSWPLHFTMSVNDLFASHTFQFYHFPSTLVVCSSQCSDRPGGWMIVSSD